MEIKAADVKKLNQKVGAGLMDCKKALIEANGDHAEAEKILKKKGMAKAEKKSGRETPEGCVYFEITSDAKQAGLVEIACQTDFVANNPVFKAFAKDLAEGVLAKQSKDVVAFDDVQAGGQASEDARQAAVVKLGENIRLVRGTSLQSEGYIYGYAHGNKIAVVVELEQSDEALGKDIAMHVAALNPASVTEDDIPATIMQEERAIYEAQLQDSNKPQEIKDKIIDGKLKKLASSLCLYGQPFVKDPKETIAELLKSKNNHVKSFIRYELGETAQEEE